MITSIPVAKKNLRQKNIHHDGGLFAFLGDYASQH
jgi:hypothetical protein|tara:strand:+ start:1039 stop:1143 length:105 start_codon:yes stop_codon:yes gene_type:complete